MVNIWSTIGQQIHLFVLGKCVQVNGGEQKN